MKKIGAQELKDQILQAFPPKGYFGQVTSCDCDECAEIGKELRNKRWDDVPDSFLDHTCSPVLLTPEAFGAFLPAYILRALDDLSGHTVTLEFTVYSLCPGEPGETGPKEEADRKFAKDDLLKRVRLMNPAQVHAIRAFLEFVQENAKEAAWLRQFITPALETVWT